MTEEDDEFDAAIRSGERTARAQELMANHCSHGRVELHGSPSFLGQMVGLPIGMVAVRCEHAPGPSSMAMDGLRLAVEFLRGNCVGCGFRDPNGLFPTLATVSQEWAAREKQERAAAELRHTTVVAAWESRRKARRAAVAAQGYAARDVAKVLDTLDPHPDGPAVGSRDAERKLRETGRLAPELFDDTLMSVLLTDASASGNGAVVSVLGELAKRGRVPPKVVADTAVGLMISSPSPEAASVLADLAGEVEAPRLVEALPNVVRLAAPTDLVFTTLPGHPKALLAAAGLVPEDMRRTITDMLVRGDPADREKAAHAAAVLLSVATEMHLPVLGPVLVRAVRGRGMAYAGEPDPNDAACEALAEAWLRSPAETRAVVEQHADVRESDTAESMYNILRNVRVADDAGADENEDVVEVAESLAAFRAARLSGDWGVAVAVEAARDLRRTARRNVSRVAPHSRATLNALLQTISVDVEAKQTDPLTPMAEPSVLTAMQSFGEGMARGNLRSALGELLGVLARHDDDALTEVVDLMHANSGDDERDARLAKAMLDALAQAVTSSNVSLVLPELYTALLSTQTRVRVAAIGLWQACAGVVGTLPDMLGELAGALLTDPYTAVHKTMLRELPRLGLQGHVAAGLVDACANLIVAYEDKGDSSVVEDALKALLWAAGHAEPAVESACVTFAFEHLEGLREYDLERMLLHQLRGQADAPAWGDAAVSLLSRSSRADMFHQPDNRLAATIFQHPNGVRAVPLEALRHAVTNYLPDLPAGAARVLTLVQGVGRYDDAATLADEAVAAMPTSDEYGPRREYMQLVADYVHAEADAARGLPPAVTGAADGGVEGEPDANSSPVVVHAAARRAVRAALGDRFPHRAPDAAAAAVTDAVAEIRTVDVATDVNLWPRMASIAAVLLRADAAVRRADPAEDTAALFAAARRQAQVAAADGEAASPVVNAWLDDVAGSDSTTPVDELLIRFARTPAPLAMHPRDPLTPPLTKEPDEAPAQPLTVVTVLTIDDAPVADLVVLDRERSYRLGIDVRAEDWPEGAVTCEAQLLSVLPKDRIAVPTATFTEADAVRDEYGVRLSFVGDLYCNVEQTPGQPGFDLPLLVTFRYGNGSEERAELAGHIRLRMRIFDPTQDAETGFRQLDGPLHQVLDRVNDDRTFDPDDVAAFARFFTAIVRAGPSITFDAAFRAGKKVSEGQFHDMLESKLLADSSLGGNVTRRDPLSGGFDDLMHDGIVAELKVEKTTPRTIDNCARYLGQPEQYGVGKDSRLSILVILDHSRKTAPAGVLENYIGWVVPAMHGYTDPRYPSMVGVVIVNTHWILPSSWSRRTIDVVEHSPTTS